MYKKHEYSISACKSSPVRLEIQSSKGNKIEWQHPLADPNSSRRSEISVTPIQTSKTKQGVSLHRRGLNIQHMGISKYVYIRKYIPIYWVSQQQLQVKICRDPLLKQGGGAYQHIHSRSAQSANKRKSYNAWLGQRPCTARS